MIASKKTKRGPILLLEEYGASAIKISAALLEAGYEVMAIAETVDFLKVLYEIDPQLVIIVSALPYPEHVGTLLKLHEASDVPIMVIGDLKDTENIPQDGPDSFLDLSAGFVELLVNIRSILRERRKRLSFLN